MRTIFTLIWGLGDSHTLRDSVSSHPTPGNLRFSWETFSFFPFPEPMAENDGWRFFLAIPPTVRARISGPEPCFRWVLSLSPSAWVMSYSPGFAYPPPFHCALAPVCRLTILALNSFLFLSLEDFFISSSMYMLIFMLYFIQNLPV